MRAAAPTQPVADASVRTDDGHRLHGSGSDAGTTMGKPRDTRSPDGNGPAGESRAAAQRDAPGRNAPVAGPRASQDGTTVRRSHETDGDGDERPPAT